MNFLAGVSKERAGLRAGTRHVTVAAQLDKGIRSTRFEVDTDDQWTAVLQGALSLYNEGPIDTMTFIYPTTDGDKVDLGVIVEKNKAPMIFQWNYGKEFNLWLIDEGPAVEQLQNGVGVQEILGLMNREGTPTIRLPQQPPIPAVVAAPVAANADLVVNPEYTQN